MEKHRKAKHEKDVPVLLLSDIAGNIYVTFILYKNLTKTATTLSIKLSRISLITFKV